MVILPIFLTKRHQTGESWVIIHHHPRPRVNSWLTWIKLIITVKEASMFTLCVVSPSIIHNYFILHRAGNADYIYIYLLTILYKLLKWMTKITRVKQWVRLIYKLGHRIHETSNSIKNGVNFQISNIVLLVISLSCFIVHRFLMIALWCATDLSTRY